MNWDDLRYFLELARTGTLTAAARRLEVQHSTVGRRIERIERAQGYPLFEREASGYRLTSAGRSLLVQAEAIAEAFEKLRPQTEIGHSQVSGNVRLACTEGFANYLGARFLMRLKQAHPLLTIEFLVRPRRRPFPRHEADISINIERPERGPYLTTRLLDYQLGLYAARSYLARKMPIRSLADLSHHDAISYVPDMEPARDLPMVEDIVQSQIPHLRSSSLIVQRMAVLQGYGIAILPDFLAREEPEMVPVLRDQIVYKRTYYMSVAQEQRAVPRIASVWDVLKGSYDSAYTAALNLQDYSLYANPQSSSGGSGITPGIYR